MMSDVWKSFIKFVFIFKRMRVVVAAVAVAVGDEYMSQNIKKVVDKKGDTRMNRVIYIVIIIVMGDEWHAVYQTNSIIRDFGWSVFCDLSCHRMPESNEWKDEFDVHRAK